MDPISLLTKYATAGAFVGAALALASRREKLAPQWMVRGMVGGGIFGLVVAILRGLS